MTHRRLDALRAIQPPADHENPPEGTRLAFGGVAARLGVTVTDMAHVAGISRTALTRLICNEWPVRTDRAALQRAVMQLLEQRGATDEELATLWHAAGAGASLYRRRVADANRAAGLPPRHVPRTTSPQQEEHDMLPLKATLTAQARRHFKLFSDPFNAPVGNDTQMFRGAEFDYVREAAWQCAQTGGFVAVVGESGAGKTTVLEDLEARLQREAAKVLLLKPSVVGMEANDNTGKTLKSADILHALISQLAPTRTMPQTLQARTLAARKLLQGSAQMGNSHLLVIEEAHAMPDATLKHLKRLHELREDRRALLGILLLAQPELKHRLAEGLRDGTLREVAQRCEIVELLPLDGDIKPYLATRAAAAGVELAKLISDDAIEQLRQRLTLRRERGAVSMCYPLAVGNLLIRALNAAAEIGVPVVTREVVAAA